ncbi:MAG: hypothetical protein WC264_02150 [Candidatus Paceibacterota bacterium]|jgi:hypothetical protein
MTEEKKVKLQEDFDKNYEALKKSINEPQSKSAKKQKKVFDFIEFSNTLNKLPEPPTSIEDIKFRGFHYES